MSAIFDVERYLKDFGIDFKLKLGKNGCSIYVLDVCPFDSSHTKGESSVIKADNGTLYFQCFHNSCQERTWHDFRQLISSDQKLGVYYSGGEMVPPPIGRDRQKPEGSKEFQPKTVTANFDPTLLPERRWIVYGSVLMGHVSIIVGPGGVCKSIYTLMMCILIAAHGTRSETDLIGPVQQYAKTLVINNEDDQEELERRIAGVMLAYDIQSSMLEGQFFYESGYGARRLICDETANSEVIRTPFADRLVAYIKDHGIELIVIDPFVSSHRSSENDNSKIDDVVQIYKSIAAKTCCAIVLVHHTRKGSANDSPTIEASRGGKALSDGCRVGEIILPLPPSDKGCSAYQMMKPGALSVWIVSRPITA